MTKMPASRHARRVRRSIMDRLPACPKCQSKDFVGFDPDVDLYCFRDTCGAKLPLPEVGEA